MLPLHHLSVPSLCVFSPLHLLWFSALFIFTIRARFYNIWLVCSLKPQVLHSCVSADMHLSKYETWRSRGTASREERKIQSKDAQKENMMMETNWCGGRQECQRGRQLVLINDLYWYNTDIIYSFKGHISSVYNSWFGERTQRRRTCKPSSPVSIITVWLWRLINTQAHIDGTAGTHSMCTQPRLLSALSASLLQLLSTLTESCSRTWQGAE